ncbi:MAG: hypothetical protein ABL920_07545 [Methylotenera sp.]|nr:hypothetical protein [Methylotenera sp.]
MNNTFTTVLIAISTMVIAGCTTTGESYTDEGSIAHVSEVSAQVNSDMAEASANLPEIAPYDEPEIPALDAPAIE